MRITFFKLLTMTITVLGFTVTAMDSDAARDIIDRDVVDLDTVQDSIAKTNTPDMLDKPEAAPEDAPVKPEKAAVAKVTIAEVDMDYVEANLKKTTGVKATVVNALKEGDMIEESIRIPADADDKVISDKLKDKKAEIIVHCWNPKCNAGMTLAERLVGLGYTNVKHYKGGIAEWTANKKPITKSK